MAFPFCTVLGLLFFPVTHHRTEARGGSAALRAGADQTGHGRSRSLRYRPRLPNEHPPPCCISGSRSWIPDFWVISVPPGTCPVWKSRPLRTNAPGAKSSGRSTVASTGTTSRAHYRQPQLVPLSAEGRSRGPLPRGCLSRYHRKQRPGTDLRRLSRCCTGHDQQPYLRWSYPAARVRSDGSGWAAGHRQGQRLTGTTCAADPGWVRLGGARAVPPGEREPGGQGVFLPAGFWRLYGPVRGCPQDRRRGWPGARTYSGQRCRRGHHARSFPQFRDHVEVQAGAVCKSAPLQRASNLQSVGQPRSELGSNCALEWLICAQRVTLAPDGYRAPIRQGAGGEAGGDPVTLCYGYPLRFRACRGGIAPIRAYLACLPGWGERATAGFR